MQLGCNVPVGDVGAGPTVIRDYAQTAEAWLSNLDRNQAKAMPLLAQTYGADQARKWLSYWRVFFMACAELWAFRGGDEWMVSHYLFQKPALDVM